MTWKEQAQRVHAEAQTFYFAFRHPRVPCYAKVIAACTAGYMFSPIQLIPNFIPGIGFLDDFLVVFLGVKLLQRIIPADVLTECREQANVAAMRRSDEVRSPATVITVLAMSLVWLTAAITACRLLVLYVPIAATK